MSTQIPPIIPWCVDTQYTIFRRTEAEEQERDRIRDPPTVSSKGRPRNARITGAIEGAPRGRGPITRHSSRQNRRLRSLSQEDDEEDEQIEQETEEEEEPEEGEDEDEMGEVPRTKRSYRCSLCKQQGHRRDKCAWA